MSAIYEGALVHVRRDRWAARSFRYRLSYACLDLDAMPSTRLFSHDRANLFSIRDRDYRVADGAAGLADGARAMLARHDLPRPVRIRLITQLRTLGYVFNPVSFFLGYDAGGALESAILEVNNTYGGHRCYVLRPGMVIERDFLVSPFLPGALRYHVRVEGPGDLRMDVLDATGERVFLARLTGTPRPFDDRALLAAAVRHPLMPVQVFGLIHWQALKLHWARVPYRRPGPDHAPR